MVKSKIVKNGQLHPGLLRVNSWEVFKTPLSSFIRMSAAPPESRCKTASSEQMIQINNSFQ